jgi:hypothetical protein
MLRGAVAHEGRRAAMTSEYKLPTANAAKQHLTGKSSSFSRNVATWVTVATSISTIFRVPLLQHADDSVVAVRFDERKMGHVPKKLQFLRGLLAAMPPRFVHSSAHSLVPPAVALEDRIMGYHADERRPVAATNGTECLRAALVLCCLGRNPRQSSRLRRSGQSRRVRRRLCDHRQALRIVPCPRLLVAPLL